MTDGDALTLEAVVALLRDLACGPIPPQPASLAVRRPDETDREYRDRAEHEQWAENVVARGASWRTRADLGLPCTCVLCRKKDEIPKQVATAPMPVATNVTPLDAPQPCRFCKRSTWSTDTTGPLHSCCLSWADHIAVTGRCPACMVAKLARQTWNLQQERRRAPRLPPPAR